MIDRLRHLIITKVLRLVFCASCSGYFYPECVVWEEWDDERYAHCEDCYARTYGLDRSKEIRIG